MRDPLRIAVIGAGWWSTTHHLPTLRAHPLATIEAIIEPRVPLATDVARDYDVPLVFTDVEELIASASIDAALVASPNALHHGATKALLEAGIPVLVEKPLALTSTDAFDLVATAQKHDLLLAVGYTAQYAPAASKARVWVREEIGELVQVIIEFSSRAGELFARTCADNATSSYSSVNGSGQAITQLSHAASAVFWTTGENATSVGGMTSNRGLSVDVEDAVIFRLTNGALCSAAATGALHANMPLRQRIRYIGTHGTVDHDLIAGSAELQRAGGEILQLRSPHIGHAYPATEPAREFIELLTGKYLGENHGDPIAAMHAVSFTEALHASAAAGAFISVAPFSVTPPPAPEPGDFA
ncbi:Gfo/Idh/MocA family oxidoreductase [Microbacterium sp. NPDC076911]|uniref:Gfo/Idh/MocA family protein n=1 Tax=Microbacterium sp. NPDC076911 TaxID=3154958 RepID=UPI003426B312